jgi:hypothetical protein
MLSLLMQLKQLVVVSAHVSHGGMQAKGYITDQPSQNPLI